MNGFLPVFITNEKTSNMTKQNTSLQELLNFAVNNVSESLFLVNPDGKIININTSTCKMLGYSRREMLKMKIMDIDSGLNDSEFSVHFKELKKNRHLMLKRTHKRKDGTFIQVEVRANYIKQGGNEYDFSFVRDLSKEIEIETKLEESEKKYRNFIEQSYEGIYFLEFSKPIDINLPVEEQIKLYYNYGYISECNLAFSKMYGFSGQKDIIGMTLKEIHGGEDIPENIEAFKLLIENNYKILNVETLEKDIKNNSIYFLNNSLGVLKNGFIYGIWGTQIEITEKKKDELRRDAIYRISEAVHQVDNLEDLFKSIHEIIGTFLHARNFYIAIYDENADLIRFPYFIDEYDFFTEAKEPGKGMTEYVLRTGKAVLANPNKFRELVDMGEVELIGSDSLDWLGVPLKRGRKTFGVLVVQSYTEGVRYTNEDKDILSFVSNQIAIAIQKKYSEDSLKINEAKYRNFVESSLEGIYFLQYSNPINTKFSEKEQIEMMFETGYVSECNDLFVEMYGYKSKEELIGMKLKTLYGNVLGKENEDALRRFVRNNYKVQNLETLEVDNSGNVKYFLNNVLGVVEDGYLIANWGTQIDITKRKNAENQNLSYKEMFSAVAKAEEHLLVEKDFDTAINKSLNEIGKALDVDRVYIFENINENPDKVYMSQKFEWCSEFASPQINNQVLTKLDYNSGFTRWLKNFEKGNMITGLVEEFPESEKAVLKPQNISSILVIPVYIEKKLWGFIGFDDCRKERLWNETEINILKTLGLAIGGVVRQNKYEENLVKNEIKLKAAFTAIPDMMFIYNQKGDFIDYYTSREDLLYLKPSEFLGRNMKELFPDNLYVKFFNIINQNLKEGEFKTIEYPLEMDEELRYFEARLSRFDNDKILSIVRDITDRNKIMEELIREKERAEEMNKIKTNFLANMSHELRTPLHGILGFAQVMMQAAEDRYFKEIATTIYKSGTRLMETLNLILNLSKIESEKIEVRIKTVKIDNIINEVFSLFEIVAKEKNIYLRKVFSKSNIFAKVDEKLLRDTLNNIVNNAIKFTKAGGATIELNSDDKDLLISVVDTGIGIPKSMQKIIFEEFRQQSEGLSRSFEGTGLGLTISKKYTELMGGKIFIESEHGVGSKFSIYIPDVITKSGKADAIKQEKVKTVPASLVNKKIKNILLVENDFVSAELIIMFLKNLYEVDLVEEGPEALSSVKGKKYDVILMDINLGEGMTGLEVTRKIRKIEGYSDIPIVAVTAFAMEGDEEEFMQSGCTHYLSKPFEKDDIINLLQKL